MDFSSLEEKIGYVFKDKSLLKLALTHSSYLNEHGLPHNMCNERIEFLGDAVLELASSDFLYRRFEKDDEGDLTKLRASLVCKDSLSKLAADIDLGSYLLMGVGEIAGGGRSRVSVLENTFEALIGAIYLDGGFTPAKDFVNRFVMTDVEGKHLFHDSKTILQEKIQARDNAPIIYELISEEGPDHAKTFTSRVLINGVEYGRGSGQSKKLSEQHAAYDALRKNIF